MSVNQNKKVQKFAIGFASVVALICVGAAVSGGGSDDKGTPTPKPNAAPSAPAKEKAKADRDVVEGDSVPQPRTKSIEGFKQCIQQVGMVAEKTAGTHVTKLSNMDDWNGILDNPKIWTNYVGGFAAHAAEGNVLASVFADCYSSKNGLVTVYGQDGHVIGTGQF